MTESRLTQFEKASCCFRLEPDVTLTVEFDAADQVGPRGTG